MRIHTFYPPLRIYKPLIRGLNTPCCQFKQIRYAHYFEHLLRTLQAFKSGTGPPPPLLRQDLAPAVLLLGFRLHPPPRLGGRGAADLSVAIEVVSERDHAAHRVFSCDGAGGSGVGEDAAVAAGTMRVDHRPGQSLDIWLGGGCCGVRVAGDVHVDMGDRDMFGHGRRLLHIWLHTAMLASPPPAMGGVEADAATATAAAAAARWAGQGGVRVLRLGKWEVDIAAKDKACSVFEADFLVSVCICVCTCA